MQAGDGSAAPEIEINDDDLHASLVSVLGGYPNLLAQLPPSYPSAPTFKINLAKMREYQARKGATFWHDLNLPMVLHNALPTQGADQRSLMASLLRTLDDFAERFVAHLGMKGTLAPLWSDAWAPAPVFWSVISCAYIATNYARSGYIVEGFERKIGDGERDSDITLIVDGIRTHVDIEMWHATSLSGLTTQEARNRLLKRANNKVASKFPHLPAGERGVANIVCVASGEDVSRFDTEPELSGFLKLPNQDHRYGFVSWLAGVRDREGTLSFQLLAGALGNRR